MRSPHAGAALRWIALYLFFSVLPLIIVLAGPKPAGRNFLIEFSVGLGFTALAMMCLQFVLTARLKWLKEPFGSDLVYGFHRAVSMVAVVFVAMHPLILFFTESRTEVLIRLDFVNHPLFPRWGFAAALALLLLAATSLRRKQWGISYEAWRRAHAILAVAAVLFGVLHVAVENHYFGMLAKGILWIVYTLMWIGIILWVRFLKPLSQIRKPWVVETVRPERGNAYTVTLAPVGHQGFEFLPGQFAWVTFFASPFSDQAHPFSISSSALHAPRLDFTVKALGDFTRRLADLHAGDSAYVDGPFGAISADRHRHASGFVMIAGGIGITPMMSHLRTFADRAETRPLLLIYANNTWDDVTFREEIDRLTPQLNLRVVHVLARPNASWDGETGFVTRDLLSRHIPLPDTGHEYFICGPPAMMTAVEDALAALGVNPGSLHSERFDLV